MIDASEFSNPAIARRVARTKALMDRLKIERDCALKIHGALLELEALKELDYGKGETFSIMHLGIQIKRW